MGPAAAVMNASGVCVPPTRVVRSLSPPPREVAPVTAQRQPAPWLPPGTIRAVGHISNKERSRRAAARQRRLPWEARRAQLLDACLNAFVARGLEMTTMSTIAAQAGVSKPLVYRHFHNRYEALLAVVEEQGRVLLEMLGLNAEAPAPSDFESLIAGFLRFARDCPSGFRLLFQMVDASSGPSRRHLEGLRAELGQALAGAMLRGSRVQRTWSRRYPGLGWGTLWSRSWSGLPGAFRAVRSPPWWLGPCTGCSGQIGL